MATEYRICECGYVYPTAELRVTKPWWRKVIWRNVFFYLFSLATATTVWLASYEPWWMLPLWYTLVLPSQSTLSQVVDA